MTDKPELLPCPFCGSEASHNSARIWDEGRVWIECDSVRCSAMGPNADTYEEAKRLWNRVKR